jgi:hypothetical protein
MATASRAPVLGLRQPHGFLENIYGPVPSGDYKVYRRIAYGSTRILSPVHRTARLALDGEDRFRASWNGSECLQTDRRTGGSSVVVEMREGWNRLIIKSSQDATREWGGRRWGMECSLRDLDGQPLRDVLVEAAAV